MKLFTMLSDKNKPIEYVTPRQLNDSDCPEYITPNSNTRTKLKNMSSKPKPEILNDKDLKDLMGQNRQTYKRGKGGAVKRK